MPKLKATAGEDGERAREVPVWTGLLVLALAALSAPLVVVVLGLIAGGVAALVVGGPGAALGFELRFAVGVAVLWLVVLCAYLAGSGLRSALRIPGSSGVLDTPIYVALVVATVAHGIATFVTLPGRAPGIAPAVAGAAVAAGMGALTVAGGAIGAFRNDEFGA